MPENGKPHRWHTSSRRDRLPGDWASRRARVLARDRYVCQVADESVCFGVATQVDHIVPGDDHRLANLQAICGPCHQKKTLEERAPKREGKPVRKHPGLV